MTVYDLRARRASASCRLAGRLLRSGRYPRNHDYAGVTVGEPRPEIYADFTLTADLSHLTVDQRRMIRVLIEASEIMDDLFWRQAYGDDYQEWLESIGIDEARRFAELNYGPWDRLNNEAPFVKGAGAKPLGANFYPPDMTKEEFDSAYLPGKNGLYSLIRRDEEGRLTLVPYHVAYADELARAADLLREAAGLAEDPELCDVPETPCGGPHQRRVPDERSLLDGRQEQ